MSKHIDDFRQIDYLVEYWLTLYHSMQLQTIVCEPLVFFIQFEIKSTDTVSVPRMTTTLVKK